MDVEPRPAVEALHEDDGTASTVTETVISRAPSQEGENRAYEDAADAGAELWRTGTSGNTRSTRWAAVSAMRLLPQDGQKPRRLQENATTIS